MLKNLRVQQKICRFFQKNNFLLICYLQMRLIMIQYRKHRDFSSMYYEGENNGFESLSKL